MPFLLLGWQRLPLCAHLREIVCDEEKEKEREKRKREYFMSVKNGLGEVQRSESAALSLVDNSWDVNKNLI